MNRRWGGDGLADADPSSHLLQLPCSVPLPRFNVRSASASPFSGLLHVDCTLQPARVTKVTFYIRGFGSFVTYTTAPIP
jgi:hypothetical protein